MSACSSSGPSAWIASGGAASGSSKILRTERENRSGGCVVFMSVSAVSWRRWRTNATNWYAAKPKPPTTVTVEMSPNATCSSIGIRLRRERSGIAAVSDRGRVTTRHFAGHDALMPRVKAGAVELYYDALGEGTPMILQAHDHTPWLFGQAPVFSQRYRFLTYDRRGTGRSSAPAGDWTPADLANDLAAFMDALGIERAIVGGSSLGGVVTAQFAVDHPGRALALIIGHTVPYLDAEELTWLEGEVATARSGGAALVRQPRSTPGEKEGPPTTDPGFAASPWGRMIAATGTGLGRTPDERARAIAVLRGWDQRPRKAE